MQTYWNHLPLDVSRYVLLCSVFNKNMMNFEGIRNKLHHQEKIKNRLRLIDLQDFEYQHLQSRHPYNPHRQAPRKNSDDHVISDWMNTKSVQMAKTTKKQEQPEKKNFKKVFSFDTTRYESSLLSRSGDKTKRLELSPMAVKFNAQLLNANLRKSKELFMRRTREDAYVTHYKSLSSRKSIERESPKIKQLELAWQGDTTGKNQRSFGLLYLLKRRSSTKIHQKKCNPEDMTIHKMM